MRPIGDVEILDRGEYRSIRYLVRRVSVEFVGGPADGKNRAYNVPAPRSTSAEHERYVLSSQGGRLFYAHADSIRAFLLRDDFFTYISDLEAA